jgi:hypothetical protein
MSGATKFDTDWRLRLIDGNHGCDEAIASAADIFDIPRACPTLSQRLAECRNMDPQRAFFDEGVRPNVLDELALCNDFRRTCDERRENCSGTTPESDRHAIMQEDSLKGKELKWPEGQGDVGLERHNGPSE